MSKPQNKKLRRLPGETKSHFIARNLILGILTLSTSPNLKMMPEYPRYKAPARADLAAIEFIPPHIRIKIWVEVQETRLSLKGWIKKLENIRESYNIDELWVVITQNLEDDLLHIWDATHRTFSNFKFFLANTISRKIYQVQVSDRKIKIMELFIKEGKIIRREKLRPTLNQFSKKFRN